MWRFSHIISPLQLWFSDGLPVDTNRGLSLGHSSRLIVDGQGFLDLTTIQSQQGKRWEIAANGASLWLHTTESPHAGCHPLLNSTADAFKLSLHVDTSGNFDLDADMPRALADCYDTSGPVSGKLKALPDISIEDIEFLDDMIEAQYVPYQNIPESPGKSFDEIRALGRKFFPFTPFSFQLAMCIYDWTTPSFTRMVLFKIFEYTDISSAPLPPFSPLPLDGDSIAEQIWASNWSTYTPQDQDYMRSFLMEPAHSLAHVQSQLGHVGDQLHRLSDVQNRLLAAALQSLPRTSILSQPLLFSGQVDIEQLDLKQHFGIEFLECPANSGPVGETLVYPLDDVLSSYVSAGRSITTKAAWSFTDSLEDAMGYANGILLVLHGPGDSDFWVWEEPAYVTPLSDDPRKNEYVSAPRTRFQVLSVEKAAVLGSEVVIINLQPGFPGEKEKDTLAITPSISSYLKAD